MYQTVWHTVSLHSYIHYTVNYATANKLRSKTEKRPLCNSESNCKLLLWWAIEG